MHNTLTRYTHVYTRTPIHVCPYTHVFTHIHATYAHRYTYAHKCTRAQVHTCTHTHTHLLTYTDIHLIPPHQERCSSTDLEAEAQSPHPAAQGPLEISSS